MTTSVQIGRAGLQLPGAPFGRLRPLCRRANCWRSCSARSALGAGRIGNSMRLCNRYCCVGRAGRRLPAHPLIEPIGGNSVAHNGNIDCRPSFSSIASDFLCFALARLLQQRSRKYGSLESKHSRVVEKLAFYTRLNQSSVRVNGIDKDIGIFGHDHRRQAQQRRFTGGDHWSPNCILPIPTGSARQARGRSFSLANVYLTKAS